MKKFLALCLVLLCITSVFAGCKKNEQGDKTGTDTAITLPTERDKTPIITFADQTVYKDEAAFYLFFLKTQYESYYGPEVLTQDIGDGSGKTFGDMLKDQALETAIGMNLCAYVAKKAGYALTEEEIATEKDNAKTFYESIPQEQVAEYGFTLQLFEDLFQIYNLRDKYMSDLYDQSDMTETMQKDIDAYVLQDPVYAAIREYGAEASATRFTIRQIQIKTIDETGAELSADLLADAKTRAEDLLARAKAGEDFATLATQYSEDGGSKEDGGKITFARGEQQAEVEEATYGMEVGDVSDLITTSYGFYIIKLEEKDIQPTADQIQERVDYEQEVLNYLKSNQTQALFAEKVEGWKTEYPVTVDDAIWATLKVEATPVIPEETTTP